MTTPTNPSPLTPRRKIRHLRWLKHREGKNGHAYIVCKHTGAISGCKNPRCDINQLTSEHKYSP